MFLWIHTKLPDEAPTELSVDRFHVNYKRVNTNSYVRSRRTGRRLTNHAPRFVGNGDNPIMSCSCRWGSLPTRVHNCEILATMTPGSKRVQFERTQYKLYNTCTTNQNYAHMRSDWVSIGEPAHEGKPVWSIAVEQGLLIWKLRLLFNRPE